MPSEFQPSFIDIGKTWSEDQTFLDEQLMSYEEEK